MTKSKLQGLKVLVTRPETQAKTLSECIDLAGGEAVTFPVIEISPILKDDWASISIIDYDMLIFVSRNAVENFIEQWQAPISEKIQMVAVGVSTARCMENNGMHVNAFPDNDTGSEALLGLPILQDVMNSKVLVVRGLGGRELLAETLRTRGAKVDYLEVYRRLLPSPSQEKINAALAADCIVVTSIAGLENLSKLLVMGLAQLKTKPLLVISERIRQHAKVSGFKRIAVAVDASDEGIMQRLFTMRGDNEQ